MRQWQGVIEGVISVPYTERIKELRIHGKKLCMGQIQGVVFYQGRINDDVGGALKENRKKLQGI